jgi:uncharacterized protein
LYKVLFHLNDEGKAEDTLRNIENLLKDIKEDIEVELVIHSKGVYPFKRNKNINREKIDMLIDKGVNISVCQNTLESLNLEKEDFVPGIQVVSSGVSEIIRKQQEGWLYIKP